MVKVGTDKEVALRSHKLTQAMEQVSKSKTTQNVRRILTSQKTFTNHLADEEAALAQQGQHAPPVSNSRGVSNVPQPLKRSSVSADGTQGVIGASSLNVCPAEPSTPDQPVVHDKAAVNDPLLRTYVPSAPSPNVMESLLSGPPLSYDASRAVATSGIPQRHFCEICGYWGSIKCLKCGARVCGLECKNSHEESRCLKFYA